MIDLKLAELIILYMLCKISIIKSKEYSQVYKVLDNYHNYLCIRHYFFPDFLALNLEVCIICENYIIKFIFIFCLMHLCIWDGMIKNKFCLWSIPMCFFFCLFFFFVTNDTSSGMCLFIFFPNVSLFLPQAYCIFAWTCLCVCSKYCVNFEF